jgi:hypothetical protein
MRSCSKVFFGRFVSKFFYFFWKTCSISNSSAEHQQITTGTRRLLQLPAKTRWFSTWTLLSAILKYEDALKAAIWDTKLPQDANSKK